MRIETVAFFCKRYVDILTRKRRSFVPVLFFDSFKELPDTSRFVESQKQDVSRKDEDVETNRLLAIFAKLGIVFPLVSPFVDKFNEAKR